LETRLIKAAKEARAIARGEITDGFVVHVPNDFPKTEAGDKAAEWRRKREKRKN